MNTRTVITSGSFRMTTLAAKAELFSSDINLGALAHSRFVLRDYNNFVASAYYYSASVAESVGAELLTTLTNNTISKFNTLTISGGYNVTSGIFLTGTEASAYTNSLTMAGRCFKINTSLVLNSGTLPYLRTFTSAGVMANIGSQLFTGVADQYWTGNYFSGLAETRFGITALAPVNFSLTWSIKEITTLGVIAAKLCTRPYGNVRGFEYMDTYFDPNHIRQLDIFTWPAMVVTPVHYKSV